MNRIYVENTGQIKLNQDLGQWIAKYGADERFSRYLEIGTWNGRGSTCCFYEGFTRRTTPYTLQSYEICDELIKEATEVWKAVPSIQILRGRILEDIECPIFSVVKAIHPNLNQEWHNTDIRRFWSCPYIPMNDPEVVLLDGAEYLTYFEFQKMKNMPGIRVFMLDDASIDKCRDIQAYLLAQPDWKRVAYSQTQRNGWAVFERIISSE